MVPDFRRDDVWMPPYQVLGRLLKSGMTEKAVYGQTLNREEQIDYGRCGLYDAQPGDAKSVRCY